MIHRILCVAAAASVWVCLAVPALAQDSLLVGRRYLSATRNFGEVLGPGPILTETEFLGGGRYRVTGSSPTPDTVTVADARTGYQRLVFGQLLSYDRARPVLFVRRTAPANSLWAVNVATNHERYLFASATLYSTCVHAYSANVLFCATHRDDGRADIVAIDVPTATTRVVTTAPLTTGIFSDRAWRPLVTPDGRRLYFDVLAMFPPPPDPSLATWEFAALDPVTGVLARHPALDAHPIYDDATERLVVSSQSADNQSGVVSLYSRDLAPILVRVPVPLVTVVKTSAHTNRMYVFGFSGPLNGSARERLWVFDASTFELLAPPVDRLSGMKAGNVGWNSVGLFTAPGPPRRVAATVGAGRTVALSWTNVGTASHFVLDVGLASGRTDLSVFVGTEPRVSFAGVPPGTYYLRVRGGNEYGGGRPSQEVRVVVP